MKKEKIKDRHPLFLSPFEIDPFWWKKKEAKP